MIFLYLVCAFVVTLPLRRADYSCMCTFYHKLPVYNDPSSNSTVIGRLTWFECKATYRYNWKYHPSALWVSIQYQNQVGYVAKSHGNAQIRTCAGSPSASDTVTPPLIDPYTPGTTLPSIPTTTILQYECLCNYHGHRVAVHPAPTKSSGVMGYLSQFDCKPSYHFTSTSDSNWKPIQFKKYVGYVLLDVTIQVRRCPGDPPLVDMVPVPRTKSTTSTTTRLTTPSMQSSASRHTLDTRSRQRVRSSIDMNSTTLPRLSEVTAPNMSTPQGSSATNANIIRSETVSAPHMGAIRQKPDSTTNHAKGISTLSPSTRQSQKECINKPKHLEEDESIDKGIAAGLVIAGFLVGLLSGAVVVLMFFKLRAKTASKYEVWFKNEAEDPKAVLHVN